MDIILRPHFGRASGKFVLELALDFLRFLPGARPCLAAVLGAVLSPSEVLSALAPPGKFITLILAVCRVPDKDCDDGAVLILCASNAEDGIAQK